MLVEYYLGAGAPSLGPAVLSIGAFDGVHRGHQRLLARTAEIAAHEGVRAVALTFWPHPWAVLRPEAELPLLTTLDEKLALLGEQGLLDATFVFPFTDGLAALSPDAFLDLVSELCAPLALVEGTEFALGQDRAGDIAFLRAAGARRRFAVESLEVRAGGARVSSTRIRELLRVGNVAAAADLLGRPYMLVGEVVAGDRRGRLLGFPTANLRPDVRKMLPANGVYAVRVQLPGEAAAEHPGVCNIGVRPTFGGEPRLMIEAHLLDVTLDLYGLTLGVELVTRLRAERRFGSVDELQAQIALDAAEARRWLADADAEAKNPPQRAEGCGAQRSQ
jgi:riboflavin kinase / FMN adenylyltransferase